jgi:hypothetical protein
LFENPYFYYIRDPDLKKVTSIQLIEGGSGYTSVPGIKIISDNGFGASATATIFNGAVDSLTLTNQGYDYTTPPTVRITGGGGQGAYATTTINIIATMNNGVYTNGVIPKTIGEVNLPFTRIIVEDPGPDRIPITGCCNDDEQFDNNPTSITFGTCVPESGINT